MPGVLVLPVVWLVVLLAVEMLLGLLVLVLVLVLPVPGRPVVWLAVWLVVEMLLGLLAGLLPCLRSGLTAPAWGWRSPARSRRVTTGTCCTPTTARAAARSRSGSRTGPWTARPTAATRPQRATP